MPQPLATKTWGWTSTELATMTARGSLAMTEVLQSQKPSSVQYIFKSSWQSNAPSLSGKLTFSLLIFQRNWTPATPTGFNGSCECLFFQKPALMAYISQEFLLKFQGTCDPSFFLCLWPEGNLFLWLPWKTNLEDCVSTLCSADFGTRGWSDLC